MHRAAVAAIDCYLKTLVEYDTAGELRARMPWTSRIHAYASIRFKLTRQWVRVDTTEHVASFFLRFLPSFVL